ncbi:multicatalytic endopeptidase [Rhodosporidiobolus nylandii]
MRRSPPARGNSTGRDGLGSRKGLEELSVVSLDPEGGGLALNVPSPETVLPIRLLTPPLRLSAVQFVVEDNAGRVAQVQVYGVPQRIDEEREQGGLGAWFPVGGVFAIRSPYPRSLSSSSSSAAHHPSYIFRLAPSTLVRLYPGHSLFPSSFLSPSAHPLAGLPPRAIAARAEEAARKLEWVRAREAAEWALSLSLSSASSDAVSDEEKAQLYALLAQSALSLSRPLPSSALRAAQAGLALLSPSSPSSAAASTSSVHPRLLLLRARAEYALQRYEKCLDTLSLLTSPSPSTSLAPSPPSSVVAEATALRTRAEARLQEQLHGPSPAQLRRVFLASQASSLSSLPSTPPDLANFLSPLLSLTTVPGRGRCVLAAAPIRRGELLMASLPLAASSPAPPSRLAHTAGLNLATRTLDPPAVGEVAAELLWAAAAWEEPVGEEVEDLWAGPGEGMGRGKGDWTGGRGRAEGAVTFNGFVVEDLSGAGEPGAPSAPSPSSSSSPAQPSSSAARPAPDSTAEDEGTAAFHAPLALYPPLGPSALNHSCLPTCSYTFLTAPPFSLFILRARRDLNPGEECTIEYVSPAYSSFEKRGEKLGGAGHGFRCGLESEAWALAESLPPAPLPPPSASAAAAASPKDLAPLLARAQELYALILRTYPPSSSYTGPRFALYAPSRLLSLLLSRMGRWKEALEAERRGLEALGARFTVSGVGSSGGARGEGGERGGERGGEGEEDEGGEGEGDRKEGEREVKLLEGVAGRDTDATLSLLWCAMCCEELGDESGVSSYLSLARSLEYGQAGAELFDLRFGGWITRKLGGRWAAELKTRHVGKQEPKRHLEDAVEKAMGDSTLQSLGTMLSLGTL